MGDNPTKAQVDRKREANKKEFGLTSTEVSCLRLPKAQTREWLKVLTYDQIMRQANNFSTVEKIHHFKILEEALERKMNKIRYLKERSATNFKLCNIGIIVQKSLGHSVFETVYEYVGTNHNVKYKKKLNRTGYRYFNKMQEDLNEARTAIDEENRQGMSTAVDGAFGGDNTMGAIQELDSEQEVSDIY